MKKLLAVLLAGILTTTMIACGNDKPADTPKENEPTDAPTTEDTPPAEGEASSRKLASDYKADLTYVSWNSTQETQNQATVDAFKKLYPDINISLSYSTWAEYWNKLEASAAGKNMADLVTQHTNNIQMYVDEGFVEDLTNLQDYDPDFSYDPHPEGVKRLYRFDDKMWGVPKDFDCIVMVYNKEMFDNASLEYPTDEWTWDDLEAASKVLTDKGSNKFGFGARNDQQGGYASFMYQNGGGLLTEDGKTALVDSAESIEAFEWWMHMYDNYSPTQAMYSESDPTTMFTSGVVAMQTIGNWDLNLYYENEDIKDKFDVVALPHPADGKKATIMNGLALCVTTEAGGSTAEKIEAGKQFAAYFGTLPGQEDAAMGPSIPCYDGVSDKWADLNKDLFNVDAVLSQMEFGVQWVGTKLKTQWNNALETRVAAIYDGGDIATELKAAATEMNDILAKEG